VNEMFSLEYKDSLSSIIFRVYLDEVLKGCQAKIVHIGRKDVSQRGLYNSHGERYRR
jgi:hypothetical protein